jgi:predicted AlkP superfamily pyrophosphatase or phosphodiesterase
MVRCREKRGLHAVFAIAVCLCVGCATTSGQRGGGTADRRVIILVWDGLRPDSINPSDTPNLIQLREAGTEFTDNHSTYPTFTMMNSASIATGGFPGSTGFYGNVVWQPGAQGPDSAGKPVDFRPPVFSEDYAVLDGLNAHLKGDLLLVSTLLDAAQKAGMTTMTLGKNGAVYLQDLKRGGMMLNEKTVFPLGLAKELQAAGMALPSTTPNTYAPGELVLAPNNGNPTEFKPPKRLNDGVSSDPTDASGSRYKAGLEYMVNAYLDYLLPKKEPRLSILWLRDPDATQHDYGVGTRSYHDAMRSNDALLGRLRDRLRQLGQETNTDLIVVSDHGHSNVSGPSNLFPLRAVRDGAVGDVDPNGHSVSGLVRLADLMRRAGFVAFDGLGCTFLPVATGIRADGSPVYPTLADSDGSICGKPGQKYLAPPLKVPAQLPGDAVVVAVNGGSDYLYVPAHDPELVRKAVAFLQSRSEVGAIFVDDRYRGIPGTLALSAIHAANAAGRNPDVIVSYDYDENAAINGVRGTEYAGMLLGNNYRGMHGSFSPVDVHNTLIAQGPDFRERFKDSLPTGNVDVAPTVARILGLSLPRADGRALLEAMNGGAASSDYRVAREVIRPEAPATGLTIRLATNPDGKDVESAKSSYTFELHVKSLQHGGAKYTYFDFAKAVRR